MLRQIHGNIEKSKCKVTMEEASFPKPFSIGLEFNAPVHGTWNIVHTGMLVPEAHQIYACAINCNRGVVMTAAEMGAIDRFSTITITEKDILYGDMEQIFIDGVSHIIKHLSCKPKMILLFPSCIHHFLGTSMKYVYSKLEEKFPDICFAKCFMDPTMQKHSLPPEQRLRRELYAGLKPVKKDPKSVAILGNNLLLDETSDMKQFFYTNGITCYELAACKTYEEYLNHSKSSLNIVTQPVALLAAKELEKRLQTPYLYLPMCYGYEEIIKNQKELTRWFGLTSPDFKMLMEDTENSLEQAKTVVDDRPIAIDYTFTPRPLGLARLLIEHGFLVKRVYLDAVNKEEEKDFYWLKENAPQMELMATMHFQMRVSVDKEKDVFLGLGQKAAYFTNTGFFVNGIEGSGQYGFHGIQSLCEDIMDACKKKKDTRELVPKKGLGCECII